jgi:protein involved in polysaccharide export with SLBB domain
MKNHRRIPGLIAGGALVFALAAGCGPSGPDHSVQAVDLPRPAPPAPFPKPAARQPLPQPVSPEVLRAERERVERELGLESGALLRQFNAVPVIQIGSQLNILVVGHPELSRELQVGESMTVQVPGAGAVSVLEDKDPAKPAGAEEKSKTIGIDALRERIEKALRQNGMREPNIVVTMAPDLNRRVTVVGSLARGGTLPLPPKSTLLDILAASGWELNKSSSRVILIRRGRSTAIDLETVTTARDVSLNLLLDSGDILILQESRPVAVAGEVDKPGSYSIADRSNISVHEAVVRLAGGVKREADLARTRLFRANGKLECYDLTPVFSPAATTEHDVALFPGDLVFIPGIQEVSVFVFGTVKRPGLHRRRSGMSVSQALAQADIDTFASNLSGARVVRGYSENQTERQVVAVDLESLLLKGDTRQDIALLDGDVLFIPETGAAFTLEFIDRLLGPFSRATATGLQIYDPIANPVAK